MIVLSFIHTVLFYWLQAVTNFFFRQLFQLDSGSLNLKIIATACLQPWTAALQLHSVSESTLLKTAHWLRLRVLQISSALIVPASWSWLIPLVYARRCSQRVSLLAGTHADALMIYDSLPHICSYYFDKRFLYALSRKSPLIFFLLFFL